MAPVQPTRVLLKIALLIALIGLLLYPLAAQSVGKASLYNWLLPGRSRLPYSDFPGQAYSLSLYDLNAMFASHQVSAQASAKTEFRVFVLGDSSTWGTLLEPEDTLAGQLNQLGLSSPDGRPLKFYNLGYPTLSLAKDLLLLDRATTYEPDLILWLFTLESFPKDKQLSSPIVQNNPREVIHLLDTYQLSHLPGAENLKEPTYWETTLFAQRRKLADILRLQLYGVMWGITGIDQYYPPEYEPAARDLAADSAFHSWQEGDMSPEDLSFDLLQAGKQAAGEVPVLFINEPVLISSGENSQIRYNFYYPRWAYDLYRQQMVEFTSAHGYPYLDTWDLVPEGAFTNTAIHTNPAGTGILAGVIAGAIPDLINE